MYFAKVVKLWHNHLGTGNLWDIGCDKVVALETTLPHRMPKRKQDNCKLTL